MKLFLVIDGEWNYDDYKRVMAIFTTKDAAVEFAISQFGFSRYFRYGRGSETRFWTKPLSKNRQKQIELHIEEVDLPEGGGAIDY